LAADEIKMSNPAIQNDFSYYRRTVSKRKMESGQVLIPPTVSSSIVTHEAMSTCSAERQFLNDPQLGCSSDGASFAWNQSKH
jgi:hypothetical protein